jgi:hypothetical protein
MLSDVQCFVWHLFHLYFILIDAWLSANEDLGFKISAPMQERRHEGFNERTTTFFYLLI